MRISDWSSDVCSSDLLNAGSGTASPHRKPRAEAGKLGCGGRIDRRGARLGLLRLPATVGYARNFRRVDRQPDGARTDRKSVVSGKGVSVSVDTGGRRSIKKKKKQK